MPIESKISLYESLAIMLIIPAFNEEKALPNVLKRLNSIGFNSQCLVIDDGSTDNTARIARELGAKVIRHPFNLGYGAALQTGYKYALSKEVELVIQMDADGQHDPDEIEKLILCLEQDKSDLVIGSRFFVLTSYSMSFWKNFGRRFFHWIGRLFSLNINDPTSGFQALNRSALRLYVSDFFPLDFPDIDVLVMAHKHKLKITECSVKMNKSPRKSRIHRGLNTFYYLYKILLSLLATTSKIN